MPRKNMLKIFELKKINSNIFNIFFGVFWLLSSPYTPRQQCKNEIIRFNSIYLENQQQWHFKGFSYLNKYAEFVITQLNRILLSSSLRISTTLPREMPKHMKEVVVVISDATGLGQIQQKPDLDYFFQNPESKPNFWRETQKKQNPTVKPEGFLWGIED